MANFAICNPLHCPSCAADIPEGSEKCPKCGVTLMFADGVLEAIDPTRYFDEDGKFVPAILAEEIMSRHRFSTMMDSKEIFVYVEGFYQSLGEVLIKRECKNRLQDEYRKVRAGEVLDYVEVSTYTKRREEPPNLLPLKNGVLNLDTMELKPYSPEYMFFNKLNVNYDTKADCPEIKKFHEEITNDANDIAVLEEVIGYCLWRGYPIHKSLMLVGGGENGKSTWLSLVRTFLGAQNVSSHSLFELEERWFSRADLFGKYANVYADLTDRALQRTGTFKMLTGGDQLAAEKKFRDSFHFVNYGKLLFSANKVPEAMDDSDAFFRRWIIIVFPNVFSGEARDPQKLKKITTDQELSGLLNLALTALKRILENGGFSHMKSTDEIREDYIRKSSPIATFVMDCIEPNQESSIVKPELYSFFAFYCRENSLPAVNSDTFFKNLPKHVTITQERLNRKDIAGRPYAFRGITLSKKGHELWSKQSKQSRVSDLLMEISQEDKTSLNRGKTLDSFDCLDHKSPILTQENVTAVLNAVVEAAKVKGSVHLDEVILNCKLPKDSVTAILWTLEREGKVYSSGEDIWKVP